MARKKMVNGVVVSFTPQEELEWDAMAAANKKRSAINKINETFEKEVARLRDGYTEDEIKSWPEQIAEARAYQADQTSETVLLDSIVSQRGGTKDELVLRIATNATQYAKVFGEALGKKQKAIADLDAQADETPSIVEEPVAEEPVAEEPIIEPARDADGTVM